MKIFSAEQIKACDAYTISEAGISSLDLMERAAGKCAEWIMMHMPKDAVFIVLCGTGNNGGDGLAITRMLHAQGYAVKAFLLQLGNGMSLDCKFNLQRLQKAGEDLVETLQPEALITDIPENIIIIDAILGTGANREAEGWLARFIRYINQTPNKKIAIDIPSGMPADTVPRAGAELLRADHTLSFQFCKQTFLHPETGAYTGQVEILDIGLSTTYVEATSTHLYTIDEKLARKHYLPRMPFTHKGTFGTALIVGGSYGMIGAAVLAVKAAARAGAGKVRAIVPEVGYHIMQISVPEAMCITSGERFITDIAGCGEANAIGIGPGMGTNDKTAKAFATFIEALKQPVLLDADALNLLAKQPDLLHKLPPHCILTPHPKEFERMFGKTANTQRRLELARSQAMRYNFYIVLKDRHTAVLTPEGDCYYNLTGNAGLATGGSGDVLAGIITGLLAQGYTSFAASILGVYLHGLAGDFASFEHSKEAMLAGDITIQLGKAFKTLEI
ncbi:MAG: NAD(P)H-hydrate dehydratase [Sphingobacteriales bacterium]|nr:MAG: NAD(P)H-hydrate dehydratase [Sphingobacteriales bacterium]